MGGKCLNMNESFDHVREEGTRAVRVAFKKLGIDVRL